MDLGAVIRNGNNEVMIALATRRLGLENVELVEALAIREGIMIAMEAGLRPLFIESDSLTVVKLITEFNPNLFEVGLI